MKHARDMVNIWPVDANVIKNTMDHGVNTLMNVQAMMIAVIRANALICKDHQCHDDNVSVILAGLDRTAQKVSVFPFNSFC